MLVCPYMIAHLRWKAQWSYWFQRTSKARRSFKKVTISSVGGLRAFQEETAPQWEDAAYCLDSLVSG